MDSTRSSWLRLHTQISIGAYSQAFLILALVLHPIDHVYDAGSSTDMHIVTAHGLEVREEGIPS